MRKCQRGSHQITMESKFLRLKEGVKTPFIDPEGYQKFVAQKEQDFQTELARQKTVP